MRPNATEFTAWLFTDYAIRQDTETGERPKRGDRRFGSGKRMRIYTPKSPVVWGISYQDGDKRVRGDDLTFRLTLAVMAFEADGYSREAACNMVVDQPNVRRMIGYKGNIKDIDRLRVRVIG